MTAHSIEIQTADGLKLHGHLWEPAGSAQALICLVHGLGEHSGRYAHVVDSFCRKKFAVVAFDLRGHGQSEGPRGHAPKYDLLISDIFQGLEKAKQAHPELPVFIYGHSLGGNLILQMVLKHQPDVAGAISSAPLFKPAFKPPAWKMAALQMFAGICPTLTMYNEVDPRALSRDAEKVRTYQKDPLVHDRISARLAKDMLAAGAWNLAHAAKLSCPLLLIHGDADRITSTQASRDFAAQAGKRCTLKIWHGLYHDPHNEPEQQDVLAHIVAWIHQHLPTKDLF
jgi:alpha-beta hydrolase superfamily lysophospholipase